MQGASGLVNPQTADQKRRGRSTPGQPARPPGDQDLDKAAETEADVALVLFLSIRDALRGPKTDRPDPDRERTIRRILGLDPSK
jgi:hypothetical protein